MTHLPPGPSQSPALRRAPASDRRAAARLWRWPLLIGVLSASGLVSALVSDSWGDAWSWLALGVPVLVMAWCSMRR